MQRDNNDPEKDRLREEQKRDLDKRRWNMIKAIEIIINQAPFTEKGSKGIDEMRKAINGALELDPQRQEDPFPLLDKIMKIAKEKESGLIGSFSLMRQGKMKDAMSQVARGAKEMRGKVDQTTKALYQLIASTPIKDPYAFEIGLDNMEMVKSIKLGDHEFDLSELSKNELRVSKKRFSTTMFDTPAKRLSGSKPIVHYDSIPVNDAEVAHSLMKHLLATPAPKSDYDKINTFLHEAGLIIKEVANDYRDNGSLLPDQYLTDKITWMIEEFRVINKSKDQQAVAEFRSAFAEVKDIISRKNSTEFDLSDVERLQRQCAGVFQAYQAIESSNVPRLK